MKKYRWLKEGEIIKEGDEVDACNDGWRDNPKWVNVKNRIGKSACDPKFVSHGKYRRKINSNK